MKAANNTKIDTATNSCFFIELNMIYEDEGIYFKWLYRVHIFKVRKQGRKNKKKLDFSN